MCDATTFFELFRKEVALKFSGEDYHRKSLIVSVSPTGKGEQKIVRREDDINLSVSFGCRYIKFQVTAFVVEPPTKCVCPDRPCAFDTLLANAAKWDCLPTARLVVTHSDELFNDIISHLVRSIVHH